MVRQVSGLSRGRKLKLGSFCFVNSSRVADSFSAWHALDNYGELVVQAKKGDVVFLLPQYIGREDSQG